MGRENGCRSDVLLLKDPAAALDERYLREGEISVRTCSGSRWRFVAAALASALVARPDVIVVGHVNFAPLAFLLRLLVPSSPHVFIVHGTEVWRPLSSVAIWTLRRARKVLAVSRLTAEQLASLNDLDAANLGLLPCALDPQLVESWSAPNRAREARAPNPTLLTVSRLESVDRYKGVDLVLRALPAVLEQFHETRYVVVGDGCDRPYLEALAREMGVAQAVEFRGRIPPDELAREFERSWLFLLPSTGEGFGIVYIEAAWFGAPSLGVRAGGVPEVIEDGVTGVLVQPGDHVGIARGVISLLRDPGALEGMGERARERAARLFGYAAFAANFQRHIRDAVEPTLEP